MPIDPEALRRSLAALRGYKVSPKRAAQLAREVERVNEAARAHAVRSDFNAQPADFAAALDRLARR